MWAGCGCSWSHWKASHCFWLDSKPFNTEDSDWGELLGKKLFSAFCISFQGRWAFPFLDPCGQACLALLGVQREGEGGADGDGELEVLALAGQCLAEVQALGGQRGVRLTHSSHFCLLLNYQKRWQHQKVKHVLAVLCRLFCFVASAVNWRRAGRGVSITGSIWELCEIGSVSEGTDFGQNFFLNQWVYWFMV